MHEYHRLSATACSSAPLLYLSFRVVSINSLSEQTRVLRPHLLGFFVLLHTSSLSFSTSDVHLPQSQLGVDYLVVVVLCLHTWQQGPDAPERERSDGLGAFRQEFKLVEKPCVLPDLEDAGVAAELGLSDRPGVKKGFHPWVTRRSLDSPAFLHQPGGEELLVDLVEVRHLLLDEHFLPGAKVLGPIKSKDLVDGVTDGQRADVVGAKVLSEGLHALLVSNPDLGKLSSSLWHQLWLSFCPHGQPWLLKLDQHEARVGVESVFAESKVFHRCRRPPASRVQTVRLGNPFCGEVVEVVLHQVLNVVAEENLELRLKLAISQLLHLPQAIGGEHLGGWFSDQPRAVVVSWNHPNRERKETVSVEDVNGLSSGHLDVLHTALPGLQSLPFPGSDEHHARLTGMAVNRGTGSET